MVPIEWCNKMGIRKDLYNKINKAFNTSHSMVVVTFNNDELVALLTLLE